MSDIKMIFYRASLKIFFLEIVSGFIHVNIFNASENPLYVISSQNPVFWYQTRHKSDQNWFWHTFLYLTLTPDLVLNKIVWPTFFFTKEYTIKTFLPNFVMIISTIALLYHGHNWFCIMIEFALFILDYPKIT